MPARFLPALLALVTMLVPALGPERALALQSVNPITADPADMRIAIRLPATHTLPQGSVTMYLGMDNQVTEETISETFTLHETGTPQSETLATARKRDQAITTFRLPSSDYDRLRTFQASALGWKQSAGDKAVGAMNLNAKPCRASGGNKGPVMLQMFFRGAGDADFVPVGDAVDVAIGYENGKAVNMIAACDD